MPRSALRLAMGAVLFPGLALCQCEYGADPKWQETMIGKLDELLKGK